MLAMLCDLCHRQWSPQAAQPRSPCRGAPRPVLLAEASSRQRRTASKPLVTLGRSPFCGVAATELVLPVLRVPAAFLCSVLSDSRADHAVG